MRDLGHSLKPDQTTKTIQTDRETRTLPKPRDRASRCRLEGDRSDFNERGRQLRRPPIASKSGRIISEGPRPRAERAALVARPVDAGPDHAADKLSGVFDRASDGTEGVANPVPAVDCVELRIR
jgi:hypothetical protein